MSKNSAPTIVLACCVLFLCSSRTTPTLATTLDFVGIASADRFLPAGVGQDDGGLDNTFGSNAVGDSTGITGGNTPDVLVDWGTVFNSQHNRQFPHRAPAAARSNSGRVALKLLRACGGGAYLPRALVENDLAAGQLFLVSDAPVFEMRAYAAYISHGEQRELVERMLGLI